MDLLCPHCQNRLSIADESAGQILSCTFCSGKFQAPALPTPPVPPPPPASEPLAFGSTPSSNAQPAHSVFTPEQPSAAQPPPSTPAPLPEGYRHTYSLSFKREVVTWIAPGGLILLFLLSFLPWAWIVLGVANPWSLGFIGKSTTFVLYVFLLMLTAIVAILCVLLDKKIFSLPEPMKKVRPYRYLILAALAGISFLFIFYFWISALFNTPDITTVWFKIAIRVHFLVIVGALLSHWLERRRKQELPTPKIEMHW